MYDRKRISWRMGTVLTKFCAKAFFSKTIRICPSQKKIWEWISNQKCLKTCVCEEQHARPSQRPLIHQVLQVKLLSRFWNYIVNIFYLPLIQFLSPHCKYYCKFSCQFAMLYATWCHLYNFTKSNTLPWLFSTYFKLYKWCQIIQSVLFFPITIFITQAYKTKKYYNHQVLFHISSTWEKAKKKTTKALASSFYERYW